MSKADIFEILASMTLGVVLAGCALYLAAYVSSEVGRGYRQAACRDPIDSVTLKCSPKEIKEAKR